MVGRTNAGGAGKLFSIITVSYPEGSVCTCTNGTKTLKAKDTSGKALFNVPVGEWTVSCTNGTDTASQAVSITADGQSVSIELSYALYLFKSGEGFAAGFTTKSSGHSWGAYPNYTTEQINLSKGTIVYFSPKVDLTQYKKLCVNYEVLTTGTESYFGVASSDYVQNKTGAAAYGSFPLKTAGESGIAECSIEDINSEQYIYLWPVNISMNIKDIWLE